jgi:hypothetical protein
MLGDPRPGLDRRALGVAQVDPPRRRLHGQRRHLPVAQRAVLTERRNAYDDKSGAQ